MLLEAFDAEELGDDRFRSIELAADLA